MTTAEIVIHCRKSAKLTQRQLAERIGMTYTTVWSWEHGLHSPSVDNLMMVMRVTGFELTVRKKKFGYEQERP